MGSVRRRALLPVLLLIILSGSLVVFPKANAAVRPQASAPVALKYACAQKVTGAVKYVSSPAKCASTGKSPTQTLLTIDGDLHYVCLHADDSVYLVGSLGSCAVPKNRAALTLPPKAAPDYFCAAKASGTLSYVTAPGKCEQAGQVAVVVAAQAHQPPVLADAGTGPVLYTTGATAVPVSPGLTVSSTDASTLASATVKVAAGFAGRQDVLAFTSQPGISGSYDAASGVLTLSGDAPLASYQAALRAVTYRDWNAGAATGTRTISFQVEDNAAAHAASNTLTRGVTVSSVAPDATDDTATTNKNTAVDIDVLSNDSDRSGQPLRVASVDTAATKGKVTVNGDGTINYDPDGQFASLTNRQTATDTFQYTVTDGTRDSAPATVTVTITGATDAPVVSNIEPAPLSYQAFTPAAAVTGALTVSDDDDQVITGATVSIAAGFQTADDLLAFTARSGITGTYAASAGVLTLTGTASLADYQAVLRSVTFAASDPAGSPAARRVAFHVTDSNGAVSAGVSRTIDVTEAAPPVAGADTATTGKSTPVAISVLANDTDPAGLSLQVASVDATSTKGKVTVNPDGTITYDPNGQFDSLLQGQSATDTFSYTATDGTQTSAPATVTVTVTGANDTPALSGVEAGPLSYTGGGDPVPVTSALQVTVADGAPLNGAAVSVSAGFSPGDALAFTSQDGITGQYDASSGVLTLTGTALAADYQAALRSVTFASASVEASGPRTVTFAVSDGTAAANQSNTAGRVITVSPVAPPAAVADTATTDKNTAVSVNVLANDSNPAGKALSVIALDTKGTTGLVSINPDGTVRYDPDGQFDQLTAGQTATDTFSYTATDGYQVSNPATVTVTITGADDIPAISSVEPTPLSYQAFTPPAPVTSALTLSDGDDATIASATVAVTSGFSAQDDLLSFPGAAGVTGSYDAGSGVLTLAGPAPLASFQAALRSVEFSAADAAASPAGRTVSFTVTDSEGATSAPASRAVEVTEAAPPTAADVSATTGKNAPVDINVLAGDTDPAGAQLSVQAVDTSGTQGTVTVNGDGTIHYDPAGQFASLTQGQSATDTFTYTVTDGTQVSAPGTVTVTVTGSNDAPVISGLEQAPLSYTAQTPPVPVTSALTISDDDDDTLAAATAAITSGFGAGQDTLSFAAQNGIAGSFDASAGVLALSGAASVSDYQAALRSVQFATGDSGGTPAARTVSFTVTDSGGAVSDPAARSIAVASAAAPPTAVGHSYTAVGNTPLAVGTTPAGPAASVSGSVLSGDTDQDPTATLSVTGHSAPGHGTVTMNPSGTFTYTPDAGYSGADSFTYTVAGSTAPAQTATAMVTVTVGPLVWYVDNSGPAGTGESGSPFNSLAAATAAAGADSVIFLYQGEGPYPGGVTLQTGQDLTGQPDGLTVGGYTLVPPSGNTPAITNSSGDGIDLASGADVEGVNVTGASGNGIAALGVDNATVGASAPVAVSGAAGDAVHVSGGDGTLNFGTTAITSDTGHSVLVTGRSGGTVSFTGPVTDHGSGISLTGNAGAQLEFGGQLTVSTGAKPAFTATGGGTVLALGSGSALATTTGTALNVQDTTIGGLDFQSVSSSGAVDGIALAGTGTDGSLTVSGTGAAGSGGTIANSTGAGIALSGTYAPSFTDMVVSGSAADGISGAQVAGGLTIAGDTVTGNGTAASVSGQDNDGLDFAGGLTGPVAIANSTITGSADNNAVISDSSGTLGLTVTASTFSANNASTGNDGLQVDADGSASATVSVTGSAFTDNYGDAFAFITDSAASGTDSVTFSQNTLNSTADGILGGGVVISPSGNAQTTVAVNGNNIQNAIADSIEASASGTSGTLSGTIDDNTIGSPAVDNSGGSSGIDLEAQGSVTETLTVSGNSLYQYYTQAGINFFDHAGDPAMNLTITGNTLADPGTSGQWGIFGDDGSLASDTGPVCAAITGNTLAGAGQGNQGGFDIELDQYSGGTFNLPGYTGAASDVSAVESFLQAANKAGGTPAAFALASGTAGFGGASC
jgi:VCBS repeat-containing protein